ncbi:hypothetical protein O7599_14370 [Streptomyces sp. WMMC500]|uniref:hypothetical protein n=1 Tax=Streptomyces sp. WMMC500 TaxID=3015154 RepID=UPI00248BABCE|nr:hypothetical protein [Streptomyces sp. WMMC500]WBB63629.1 hypothetical protein O7599_14370 [Streptomyces sp. WMMC500]
MKAGVKRALGRVAVGLVTASAAAGVMSGPASADSSPYIESKSHDCAAKWVAPTNAFYIDDRDVGDGKHCTVKHSFYSDKSPYVIPIPPDGDDFWGHSTNNSTEKWVYFKVCDWVNSDIANCTDWKRYGT